MKHIVFDKDVVDADVDRLKKMGYPDDLIEIFIRDGQARARPLEVGLTLRQRIRQMFNRKGPQ